MSPEEAEALHEQFWNWIEAIVPGARQRGAALG
jgi:hypothetical protein